MKARRFKIVTALAVAAAVVALSTVARAQVPAGPEFRVNAYTTDSQWAVSGTALGAGQFVLVWADARDDVLAQRFDASGRRLGDEFTVNSYTTGQQWPSREGAVAADGRGNFVVVWTDFQREPAPSWAGIFGQRFDRLAQPIGSEFHVNSYTTGTQSSPAVAVLADGGFVVVWSSVGQDGSLSGVFGQRFDAMAVPAGSEFQVNQYTTDYQTGGQITAGRDGDFVVAWTSSGQDGSYQAAMARKYDPAATPRGPEFQLSTNTAGAQSDPSVAFTTGGEFVACWYDSNGGAGFASVMGGRFGASGGPIGPEFQVNVYTPGGQYSPAVASDTSGNFVVSWVDTGQDGSSNGVIGRRFTAAAAPRSAEFRVNTYTTQRQWFPFTAIDPVGNFLVSWESQVQDGSQTGVYAQGYGGLVPSGLRVTDGAEGVLEPGETVGVRPAWLNVNVLSQSFSAAASAFTGPPGATYTIQDATAAYGTVPSDTVGECSECYVMAVSAPPARPALHWDASFLEAIVPDAQGQRKSWALHIGDSFADVPRSSSFYRFIETLLHHSVTGGCTTTTYCPANVASREQMSVFVLVSKEGPGYRPPPCTTPVFADVPAASPFCRFVEELARRGVVSGCGGGNYCPQAAVSREQMAVFVLRTLDPASNPPACTTPVFADVPAGSPFCRWIEELARRGIVSGCGGGNYCPASPVTREQMAVFLGATFGLRLYGP